MVLGTGVDIISIKRMKDSIDAGGKVFLDKVFTTGEQRQASLQGNAMANLAMTFAGKEAIFKSFATSWNTGVKLTEIEITYGKNGEPIAALTGRFAQLAKETGAARVLLSLSYDGDYAIASATLT